MLLVAEAGAAEVAVAAVVEIEADEAAAAAEELEAVTEGLTFGGAAATWNLH